MKSIFTHISLLGVLTFVFSCSPPPAYLGSGFHGKDMAYWAKPATKDSAKISAIYSTGSLSSSRGYQTGDQLFIAQGAVYQSHTSKSTNVSYGIFGYVGRYSIGSGTAPLDKFQGNYGLYGTGIRASFNFNSITSKSFDWRFLGVDVA